MKNYKTPILTSVFNIFGMVCLFVAGLGLIGLTILLVSAISKKTNESFAVFGFGLGLQLSLIFTGLIQIGIAQAIDFLGRTAHATNYLCNLVEVNLVRQIQALEKSFNSNGSISNKSSAVKSSTRHEQGTKKNIVQPIQDSAQYYYSIDGKTSGPYIKSRDACLA